jgi:hypothetical protein
MLHLLKTEVNNAAEWRNRHLHIRDAAELTVSKRPGETSFLLHPRSLLIQFQRSSPPLLVDFCF